MTNSVRIVAEDETTTLAWIRPPMPTRTDPIFCQTSELAMAPPRVVDEPRISQTGRVDLTAFADAAQFRASLIVRDNGGLTRHQWADVLRAAAAPWRRPWLYIQRDGWPAERRARLRGDPVTSVVTRTSLTKLEVSIQFAIPDGTLESVTLKSATVRPTLGSTGMSFPMSFPLSFAVTSSGSTIYVTNAGTAPSQPLLRLYGGCSEPVIHHLPSGRRLEFNGLTLADGQYLEIDVAARTVFLNGDTSLSYYNKLNFATSDWWDLAPTPDTNSVWVTTSAQDASCELGIFWRDRWI